jgi:ornithine cyclodeaminase
MVLMLDTPALGQLLQQVGLETFIRELADRIEADFIAWPRFDKSPRMAAHSAVGVLELMPAADDEWFSFKLVNGHPHNPKLGLLTVTAVGMLADVRTGYPRLISEMTVLTALRTAATSAMVARKLAPAGAHTMALIGSGCQSEFQALGFKACLGIRRIRYFDPDRAAMDKFARNLCGSGLVLERCASAAEAINGAQIITTATAVKGHQIVFPEALVAAGVHVNAIGGDCPGKTELDPALLRRARIVVEYLPQTRIEGDIQLLGGEAEAIEFWQIANGSVPARAHAEEVTVFDSVGFALEDYSALRYVYDKARALKLGREVDLVPDAKDPKDLFGYATALRAAELAA